MPEPFRDNLEGARMRVQELETRLAELPAETPAEHRGRVALLNKKRARLGWVFRSLTPRGKVPPPVLVVCVALFVVVYVLFVPNPGRQHGSATDSAPGVLYCVFGLPVAFILYFVLNRWIIILLARRLAALDADIAAPAEPVRVRVVEGDMPTSLPPATVEEALARIEELEGEIRARR